MDPQPTLGPDDLLAPDDVLANIIGEIAYALAYRPLACRPGEPPSRRDERSRTAADTIRQFHPGDAVEAMIAGHCVIFHELIVDNLPGTFRGAEQGTERRAMPGDLLAMDRAFGANLTRLERYRTRQAERAAEVQALDAIAETKIGDRVRRHRPDMPFPAREPESRSEQPPETTAAHDAADPPLSADSALADQPGDARLASAAARMAGLNRKARREFGRQARKRLTAATSIPGNRALRPTSGGPPTAGAVPDSG
jgi:hypothetical protein